MRLLFLLLLFACAMQSPGQEHHQTISLTPSIDKSAILGIWWSPEMQQSAAFQIEDSTIYYPDQFAQYKYALHNDSLFVFRDEGVGISVIVRVTADTLVLSAFGHEDIFTRTETQPAESITTLTGADGVVHRHIVRTAGPLNVHTLSIDLRKPELDIITALALDSLLGRERTSSIAKRHPNVLAAINADFFNMKTGEADLNQVMEGEIVKGVKKPLRSQFGIGYSRTPYIESFMFEGSAITRRGVIRIDGVNIGADSAIVLLNHFSDWPDRNGATIVALKFAHIAGDTIVTVAFANDYMGKLGRINDSVYVLAATKRTELNGIAPRDTVKFVLGFLPKTERLKTLVGGLPAIIRVGEIIAQDSMPGMSRRFSETRHPRTGVGFSKDGHTVYFVTVDGRQESSVGMSLTEFAELMLELGCYYALNLDGGGSTTMVVEGKVVNSPSDATGERPVANVLMVVIGHPMSGK